MRACVLVGKRGGTGEEKLLGSAAKEKPVGARGLPRRNGGVRGVPFVCWLLRCFAYHMKEEECFPDNRNDHQGGAFEFENKKAPRILQELLEKLSCEGAQRLSTSGRQVWSSSTLIANTPSSNSCRFQSVGSKGKKWG